MICIIAKPASDRRQRARRSSARRMAFGSRPGTRARYPARAMTAARLSRGVSVLCRMRTRREARLRLDSVTPGRRASADSTRVTQAAQLTPSTSKTVSACVGAAGGAGAAFAAASWSPCKPAHPAQQKTRGAPPRPGRVTGLGAGSPQWAQRAGTGWRSSLIATV